MRTKRRFVVLVCLMIGIMFSCSKNSPNVEFMSGYVKDVDGLPIPEAVVKTNSFEVKTDQYGFFSIEHVQNVNDRYIIHFSKQGYFPVVRSCALESAGLMEVVLVKENIPDVSTKSTFTASKGAKIAVGKTVVDFPANGIIYEDGTPYMGKVNVNMLYLDPTKSTFQAAMPGGDLIAQRLDKEEVPLVSYGMVNVEMKDVNGKKLQINDQKKSKVTFPIPDGMADKAPDQMPLWHFNEVTGIWVESGVAVKNGDVYEGEVEHFSWVNLDDPKQFVVLKGKVTDDRGNRLPGVRITVEQVSVFSDENGEYSVRIPSETPVKVFVRKEDYLNYENEFSVLIEGQPGNSTFTQNIQLPSFPSVKGELENMCDKNVVFPVCCSYEMDGNKMVTPLTLPDKDGDFSVKIPSGAQKVQLCVKVPGSDDEVRDIDFNGVDYTIIGSVVVCRKSLAEREKPRITIDGKEIFFEDNEFEFSGFHNDSLFVCTSSTTWTIYKYVEDSTFYNNCQVFTPKYEFKSSRARIEKNKVDNYVSISIVATGKAKNENGEEKDAVVEGTYNIPYIYYGKCDDFSKLCWDFKLPTFRTPMSYVEQSYILGMPMTSILYDKVSDMDIKSFAEIADDVDPFSLKIGYIKADDKARQKIISTLTDAGYEMDNSKSGKITFTKGDVIIVLRYEKNHTYDLIDDGPKVQMVVEIDTGLLKWFKYLINKYLKIKLFS